MPLPNLWALLVSRCLRPSAAEGRIGFEAVFGAVQVNSVPALVFLRGHGNQVPRKLAAPVCRLFGQEAVPHCRPVKTEGAGTCLSPWSPCGPVI